MGAVQAYVAIPLIIVAIWLTPFILVIRSNKTYGGEKTAWVLAMFFISWFAWIFYMLIAPIKKKDPFSQDMDDEFTRFKHF